MMAADRKDQANKSRAALEKRLALRREAELKNHQNTIREVDKTIEGLEATKNISTRKEVDSIAKVTVQENGVVQDTEPNDVENGVDFTGLLLANGVVSDLDYVSKVLQSSLDSTTSTVSDPRLLYKAFAPNVQLSSGPIALVNPATLSAIEYVTFKYGLHQMQDLQDVFQFPNVRFFISTTLPEHKESTNSLKNVYAYNNSVCILHRDALKSVGVISIIAAHLSSHLASGLTFNDADTVFKRVFFNSISILNNKIPVERCSNVDYTEIGKQARIEKFKKHLRASSYHHEHHRQHDDTTLLLHNNMAIIAKHSDSLSSNPSKILSTEISQIPISNQNDATNDDIFLQLLQAIQSGDECRIVELQHKLDQIDFKNKQE